MSAKGEEATFAHSNQMADFCVETTAERLQNSIGCTALDGRLREIANGRFVEAKHEGSVAARQTALEKPDGQKRGDQRPPRVPNIHTPPASRPD
jgi:hypothetical protein